MPASTDEFRKRVLAPMGDRFQPVKYASFRVADQARQMLGWLARDLPIFEEKSVPITRADVETLELCLAVLAEEGADLAERKLDRESYKELVAVERQKLLSRKRQVLLWAKASPVEWRMFNVNLGGRSVPRLLDAAELLAELLTRHEDEFVAPAHVAQLCVDIRGAVARLRAARVARGLDDADSKQDTLTARQAVRVMYDALQRISYIGQATFFEDTPHREGYELSLLQSPRPERAETGTAEAPIAEEPGIPARVDS